MSRSWDPPRLLLPIFLESKKMASRSTRNKIRFQAKSAYEDLKAAQDHMVLMGVIINQAGSTSYTEDELPQFIASLEIMLKAWESFW